MSREVTPLPPQVLLHLTAPQELNPFTSASAMSVPVYSSMKALGRASSSDHQHIPQLVHPVLGCYTQLLPSAQSEQVPLSLPQNKQRAVPAKIFCLAWTCSRRRRLLFLSAHPDFVRVTNAFSGCKRV